jgi:ubiquinone/menaquinone biosynthesis C-methylase UbiE
MTTPPVCDYENSDYQVSFWDKGGRAYEDAVEAVALGRLLPARGKILLELGAGAGRNTPRYRGFDRVVLLDYSHTQLEQARRRLGDSDRYLFVAANIYKLPFSPGLFDAATMIRTLHHMADPELALNQVSQTLTPGATLILEYANKQNLKAIFRYLLGRQKWSPFSPEPVEFTALNFDFHPKAIRRYLVSNGFTIHRQLTVSHYRMGFFKRWFPLSLLVKMDSLAQLTGNWWQLSPSVFVQAQAGDQGLRPIPGAFFRCPVCSHGLPELAGDLVCPGCGTLWPYENGIYDFREKEA